MSDINMIYEQKTKLMRRKTVVAPVFIDHKGINSKNLKRRKTINLFLQEISCIFILNEALKVLFTVYEEHLLQNNSCKTLSM